MSGIQHAKTYISPLFSTRSWALDQLAREKTWAVPWKSVTWNIVGIPFGGTSRGNTPKLNRTTLWTRGQLITPVLLGDIFWHEEPFRSVRNSIQDRDPTLRYQKKSGSEPSRIRTRKYQAVNHRYCTLLKHCSARTTFSQVRNSIQDRVLTHKHHKRLGFEPLSTRTERRDVLKLCQLATKLRIIQRNRELRTI